MTKEKIKNLLLNNKVWVEKQKAENPTFFSETSGDQTPEYLWIGCSDSRVPANTITGTSVGDIFVHRNIANMVVHTDMNMLSVLSYAVDVLKVKHIVVCGHYGCGGVTAAMGNRQFGLIDNWLRHIKDVYKIHQEELDQIEDTEKRTRRFIELNVIEQVYDLCKTSIIQNAWDKGEYPYVHGWVFDIYTGYIKDLGVTHNSDSKLDQIYQLANLNKKSE